MPALSRTALTTSQKTSLAATAVADQGRYGVVTELARTFSLSRPTVYQAASDAKAVLNQHFEESASEACEQVVVVSEQQLCRAVVALRAMSPNSMRAIEDLIPVLYPGVRISYGKVQGIVVEAEVSAAAFSDSMDLSDIKAGALDELFSQGDPVLAGLDLKGGYVFLSSLQDERSGEAWAAVLEANRRQGLKLETVVKDAALGLAAGVREVYPDAEQRDDCFHASYEMGKARHRLERKAYGAMARVQERERALEKAKQSGRGNRRRLAQKLRHERRKCGAAMELHDEFERACRRAREAMEVVDLDNGALRTPEWMQAELEAAAAQMMALDNGRCRKVGRYIHNRAPGLALYADDLNHQLTELSSEHGDVEVMLACIIWRIMDDLGYRRRPCRKWMHRHHLAAAYTMLVRRVGHKTHAIIDAVDDAMTHRYRASSAIEGFNGALRPYLYVHKRVTQGFLDLHRAYYNLRTRRWGPHKGTSAYECLTGTQVDDWLSLLGYPPPTSPN